MQFPTHLNKLSLNFFHAASSSPSSIVQASFQWSNNGQDWYNEVVNGTVIGTTTQQWAPNGLYQFQQVASTTDFMTGTALATTTQTVEISNPDRARYFRAFFYVPAGASPSAIHAEIVPRKESI